MPSSVMAGPILIVFGSERLLLCCSQVPPATSPIVSPCLGLDGYQALSGVLTGVRGCPRLMPKRREAPAMTPFVFPVLPFQWEEKIEAIETLTDWCLKFPRGPFGDIGRTQSERDGSRTVRCVDCRSILELPKRLIRISRASCRDIKLSLFRALFNSSTLASSVILRADSVESGAPSKQIKSVLILVN